MYSHEGEIILKERYGSSARDRHYVKPTDQQNIVVVDSDKFSDVSSLFTRIFLPQGYPDSVSKDYIAYQIWDTAQAFCSTITGTLATQEVLRGVGVGDTSATPLAATVTWVIKDGCGHLGKIVFAFSHGTYLDAYSKKWRLYADTLNDAAMCIEIALPLFKNYTTFALCVSTVMKAIVGVAGGATRAAMTQHHAIRGNLADVSAKDSAQETAVNLVASFTALFIISVFGNSILIFVVMMIFHIIFNYLAVRAVCLRTLNEPRFIQVIDTYLRREVVANPCEVNRSEPIIFYQLGPNLLDLKICGFQIKLGHSMKHLLKQSASARHITKIRDIYSDTNYILLPNTNRQTMFVYIKEEASVDDVLCSYFHAVLLSVIICAINDRELPAFRSSANPKPFAEICSTLQAVEWSRIPAKESSGFNYEPSYELLRYVHDITIQEWPTLRSGLIHTGWELSKHLLMLDEWRVCATKITSEKTRPKDTEYAKLRPFSEMVVREDSRHSDESFTIEPDIPIASSEKLKVSHDSKHTKTSLKTPTSDTPKSFGSVKMPQTSTDTLQGSANQNEFSTEMTKSTGGKSLSLIETPESIEQNPECSKEVTSEKAKKDN